MINKENKTRVFITIIAILLIANIAMLSFFLFGKDKVSHEKRPDRKTMISNFLKNEIAFSAGQLVQYDSISNRHRDSIKTMFEKLRGNKGLQFKQLVAGDFSDSVITAVAEQSAASQKMMELRMFNHLKNIRLLCTPEQLPKFDSLFVKVLNRRGEGRKNQGNKKQ